MMLKCSSDFILWLTFVCATFCFAPHACCDGEHRVEFPDQISDTIPSLLLELHVQCMCVTILNDLRMHIIHLMLYLIAIISLNISNADIIHWSY